MNTGPHLFKVEFDYSYDLICRTWVKLCPEFGYSNGLSCRTWGSSPEFDYSFDLNCRTWGTSPESDNVSLWYNRGQCSSWWDHQVMEMLCQGQREGQENCSDQVSEGNIFPAIQDPLIHCSATQDLLVIHIKRWFIGKSRCRLIWGV